MMPGYIAQWDSTPENANMSGLHRYSSELYKRTSQIYPVRRCSYKGINFDSYNNYTPGDVTHITTQSFAFLKALKRVKNCVLTVNDLIPQTWYSLSEKIKEKWLINEFVLGKMDRYIAISSYTEHDLLYHYNIDEEKVYMIYDGVDHDIYYPRDKAEARKKFSLDLEKHYFLAISSGLRWKNMELLEKLAKILPDDCEILNIGYGKGKLGYVAEQDMPDLYSACDIFLAPSKAEGFCLPVVEAMACGTPIIASMATALQEVVYRSGIQVNPDDASEWKQAIDTILSSRDKWSSKALKRSEFFSWDKCAERTAMVYKGMME